MGHDAMMGAGWMGGIGFFGMALFWLVLFSLVMWLLSNVFNKNNSNSSEIDAVSIVKQRYARGEISKEEKTELLENL